MARKFLSEILKEESIKEVHDLITKKILEDNPGADIGRAIRPGIKDLIIDYYPPVIDGEQIEEETSIDELSGLKDENKPKILEDPFEDICIMLDNSTSITSNIYDKIVDNITDKIIDLQEGSEGKIKFIRFAGNVYSSEWIQFKNLNNTKSKMKPYIDGCSEINIKMLTDSLINYGRQIGVIMITDGVIENHDEVLHYFKKWVSKDRKLALIYFDSPGVCYDTIPKQIQDYIDIADLYYANSSFVNNIPNIISIKVDKYIRYLTRREPFPECE
ncbi:hypothetical protein ACFL1H_01785 [Nanoarchaeota archaeon]